MDKIVKYLGAFTIVLKLVANLLKWDVIKFKWDLPGKPLLYAKLKQATEDKKITSSEIKALLEELKTETPDWANTGIDILIWIVDIVKPIDWDISGPYEKFWQPTIDAIADNYLTNKEVGDILTTLLNY